jgi:hypothetical protein
MRFCIYCGCELLPVASWDKVEPRPGHLATIDHVFPRRMIRYEVRPAWWLAMNEQFCCSTCNGRKGGVHPLKWLAIMPSDMGAQRLAALLVQLLVPRRRVNKWMAKRGKR